MEQNKVIIGKVRSYDNKLGVGEIISMYNSYLFLKNDVNYDDIAKGDLVKFRAEKIHDQNKAFFISKYNIVDDMGGKIAKSKVYKSDK